MMHFLLLAFLSLIFIHNVTAGCESYSRQTSCMSGSYDGVKCAWCSSGAVGSSCYAETDAKALPSSIFSCSYQAAYGSAAAVCDEYATSSTCLAGAIPGDKCAWCKSAAVGNTCFSVSDAKSLPSSVFQCTFPAALQQTGYICESLSYTSPATCLRKTGEDGIKCAWCSSDSFGVSSICLKETDAKNLSPSIYHCSYSSK
jgi:hypothetical protein